MDRCQFCQELIVWALVDSSGIESVWVDGDGHSGCAARPNRCSPTCDSACCPYEPHEPA